MQNKNIWRLLLLLLPIGAMVYILVQTTRFSPLHTDFGVSIPTNYPILGIDVSHHQGNIDFYNAVHMVDGNDSIQFVYIKATEGSNWKDENYDANAEGFAAEGMNYGFYHFYRTNVSARQQAKFFAATVKNYNFKLIPALDIEINSDLTKAQLQDSVSVFLSEVERLLNVRPIIYTYWSFFTDYFAHSDLEEELFWMASYSRRHDFMEKDNVVIWQFSESGTVGGIETKVDLNVAKNSFNTLVIHKRK